MLRDHDNKMIDEKIFYFITNVTIQVISSIREYS